MWLKAPQSVVSSLTVHVAQIIVIPVDSKLSGSQEQPMRAGDGGSPASQTGASPYRSDVLDARIRANEWRLIGMASGPLAVVLASSLGSLDPTFAPVVTVAPLGLPVAIVSGWIFGPVVATAPWRWLLPVVVGTAIGAALLGWLGASAMIVFVGLVFAVPSGGFSVVTALGISAVGIVFVVPALVVILPSVAVWALLLRVYVAWRGRIPEASRAPG